MSCLSFRSGRAQDIIKQALISDNLQDVIDEIESRHYVSARC